MHGLCAQKELLEKSKAREAAKQTDRDEATVERLRSKFLQTALSYRGVPYARRYHDPECKSAIWCKKVVTCA